MAMQTLRIGTRGSPLALAQAKHVQNSIKNIRPEIETQIVEILTSGDWKPEHGENALNEADGGKGLFAKEIEKSLLSKDIDIAVHSMKDMETELPDGLEIPFVIKRENYSDCLILSKKITNNVQRISDLPKGCTVGTSSVRRKAFLLNLRPDIHVIPMRGNVYTRLDKLERGYCDATFLAIAGLNRLGLASVADVVLDEDEFLPAASQGAVGIEVRSDKKEELSFLNDLNCIETQLCVSAEREALRVLDGSCHTPIAALARLGGENRMWLVVRIVSLDGVDLFEASMSLTVKALNDAINLGHQVGLLLKDQIPEDILK